jgi:hypothetical protein
VAGLSEGIEKKHEGSSGQTERIAGTTGMGRLLFERSRNENFLLGLVVSGIFGVLGTAMLADRTMKGAAVGPLAVALAVLFLGWVFGRDRFRCYERGLSRRRAREFSLLYDEISELTYSATRVFVNGSYSGTKMKLRVRAQRGEIWCAAKVQVMDDRLVELRDQIAERIANKMLRDLRAGSPVPWMSGVVFLPEGLQFRRKIGFPVEMLPYGEIRETRSDQGVFYLFSKTEPKAVISRPVDSTNFFPGYRVMAALQKETASRRPGLPAL